MIPLLLTWLLIEIGLIVLDPVFFKGFWQYDPDIGFRVWPGFQHSNKFGFNDIDRTPEKAPGTYRIMFLGDSYNWCGTIPPDPPRSPKDMNYTAILQRMFDKAYGTNKVEIVNAGYPATHTAEELTILKKYGLQEKPDLLVLGFFAGNDLFDGDPYRKRIIVNQLYLDIDRRHEMRFMGYPIIPQSRLWMLLKQEYQAWKSVDHAEKTGSFSQQTYDAMVTAYLTYFDKKKLAHGDLDPNIHYIFGALDDMCDLMKQDNIDFKVAIYPCDEQIDPKVFQSAVKAFKLNPDDYDMAQVQRLVADACNKKGIPYLDMLSDFKAAGQKETLYVLRNTHWNDAGNTLAAQSMYRWLQPTVDNYFKTHPAEGSPVPPPK
ncbi:MAG TPA: hypothetical protein VGO93_24240 [Candidatus Xenobia bacterium]